MWEPLPLWQEVPRRGSYIYIYFLCMTGWWGKRELGRKRKCLCCQFWCTKNCTYFSSLAAYGMVSIDQILEHHLVQLSLNTGTYDFDTVPPICVDSQDDTSFPTLKTLFISRSVDPHSCTYIARSAILHSWRYEGVSIFTLHALVCSLRHHFHGNFHVNYHVRR